MVDRRSLALVALLVGGCGPQTAGDGESSTTSTTTSEAETSGETETETSGEPEPDLLSWPDLSCDCEPGTICMLSSDDAGCSAFCVEPPPSCGDAPSCDPACNWDLCEHVNCFGEVAVEDWCPGDGEGFSGWACSSGMICNPWLEQHCPDGEVCRPFDSGIGDHWWSATRCNGSTTAAIGEACTSEGPFSGLDDCEAHAICWDLDPNTNTGTCVPQCTGAPHDPLCPPGTDCVLADPMYAAFCLAPCDPFTDSCSPGYQCTKVGETLACMPLGASAAALGQACEHDNACAATLACVEGTCAQLCDLDAPNCPMQAPNCAPAQTNVANVGLCTI